MISDYSKKRINFISLFILVFPFWVIAQEQSCKIIGSVMDSLTKQPLPGSNVVFKDLHAGVSTDNEGSYKILNVPVGSHVMLVSMIAYKLISDTINVSATDSVIKKNFYLKINRPDLVSTPMIEQYQDQLLSYSKNNNLLTIHLDAINSNGRSVIVRSTFTNNSPLTVYVIQERECFRVVQPIVRNENGDSIRQNCVSMECDVMPYSLINKSDLIEIKSKQSVQYPPTNLCFMDFNHYPKGQYQVKIMYRFLGPTEIGGSFQKPEDDAIYNALRGTFYSENALYFMNN